MNKEIFKDFGKSQKAMILKEAHDTGEPILKVASKYTLPEMAILNDEGKFNFKGKMITVDEWKATNPLAEHGRIVTINTQTNINKLK